MHIPLHRLLLPAVLAALCTAALPLHAQEEPSEVELKLRDVLKSTVGQLRAAQGEVAALQATQYQNEDQIKKLKTQVEKLTKQSTADQAASKAMIDSLETEVAKRGTEIERLNTSLASWKEGHEKITEIARAKEAERAKLEAKANALQLRVEAQQRKNLAMYELGQEILHRYEKFGLGDALTMREPFIQTTKVKFQNLVQDYRDKLTDNTIKE